MGQLPDVAAVAEAAGAAGGAAEKERWALALRAAQEDRLDDVPRTYLLGTMATLLKFARPINAFRIQLRSWTIGGTMAIPVPASRGLLVGRTPGIISRTRTAGGMDTRARRR